MAIQRFEDLIVWQRAQDLAVEIYQITKSFPKDELYAMTDQLKRAVSSISANIAEGFGRATSSDKRHFYTMAYGSLLEVKNFLYLSERLGYISKDSLSKLLLDCAECQKLINTFKKGAH